MGRGWTLLSSALPVSKSSLTTRSWPPWQMSLMSEPEYPSEILERSSRLMPGSTLMGAV